jgi:Zn-dependent protease
MELLGRDTSTAVDPYGEPTITTARAPRGAWTMGRIMGADVHLHWSMILIPFVLVTIIASSHVGGSAGDALMWTALWSLVASTVIWSHCYAHVWVADEIATGRASVLLTPFAPLAHDDGRGPAPRGQSPRCALRSALAGPVSHAVWAALGYAAWTAFDADSGAARMLYQFVLVNLALWAANLLPFHPLDGGRVLRAALTPSIGAARAQVWTASAGYGGAVTLGLGGLTLLMNKGDETLAPWAVFVVALGVITLAASQRALFAAQFRAHSERMAAPPPAAPDRVPDYLDESALAQLVESGAARAIEDASERAVESAEDRRRRLQERIDALLDRINEVGGMAGLSADERRELAETSELLRRETADG